MTTQGTVVVPPTIQPWTGRGTFSPTLGPVTGIVMSGSVFLT